MIVCPKCGNQAQDDAIFCDQCGTRLSQAGAASAPETPAPAQEAVICPSCGFSNVPGEMFCENCGTKLAAPEPVAPPVEAAPAPPAPAPEAAAPVTTEKQVVCPSCGSVAAADDDFCYVCGADLRNVEPVETVSAPQPPAPAQDVAAGAAGAVESSPGAKCPFCGAPIQGDEEFCGYCGAALQGAAPVTAEQATAPVTGAPSAAPAQAGNARLVVVASGAEIPLPSQDEILVGREDPVSSIFPDVDLTPHGGDEGGVSRQHFQIRQQGSQYSIEDLNSTNYTMLNKNRLEPGVAQPLTDGDEIRAGRVRLVFKVS